MTDQELLSVAAIARQIKINATARGVYITCAIAAFINGFTADASAAISAFAVVFNLAMFFYTNRRSNLLFYTRKEASDG